MKREHGEFLLQSECLNDQQIMVCSKHFESTCFDDQYKMKPDSLPTLFLGQMFNLSAVMVI